jgi:hypothetical protein
MRLSVIAAVPAAIIAAEDWIATEATPPTAVYCSLVCLPVCVRLPRSGPLRDVTVWVVRAVPPLTAETPPTICPVNRIDAGPALDRIDNVPLTVPPTSALAAPPFDGAMSVVVVVRVTLVPLVSSTFTVLLLPGAPVAAPTMSVPTVLPALTWIATVLESLAIIAPLPSSTTEDPAGRVSEMSAWLVVVALSVAFTSVVAVAGSGHVTADPLVVHAACAGVAWTREKNIAAPDVPVESVAQRVFAIFIHIINRALPRRRRRLLPV